MSTAGHSSAARHLPPLDMLRLLGVGIVRLHGFHLRVVEAEQGLRLLVDHFLHHQRVLQGDLEDCIGPQLVPQGRQLRGERARDVDVGGDLLLQGGQSSSEVRVARSPPAPCPIRVELGAVLQAHR
eukprot:1809635-Pyramimonas_sp.AAC.1